MAVNEKYFLAGDIGGTKTVLALYQEDGSPYAPTKKERFVSRNYSSLGALVSEFLAASNVEPARASFGVAGPVQEGRVKTTNLPWLIEQQELEQTIHAPVRLLNDLSAIAHAIPYLQANDVETINPGVAASKSPLAVVAPGTGLGEAFLTWSGGRYHAHPSEGGHADFAPVDSLQTELLLYLQPRFGHVSFERVCSGSGVPNLYNFLKDSGRHVEPGWLRDEIEQASDATPIIVQAGVEGRAEICGAALDLFASILGGEAGNMALKVLATGGIYLAGGMPGRVLSFLRKPAFLNAFVQKGRFTNLLRAIPAHVVINPEVALFGAACHGNELENFDE